MESADLALTTRACSLISHYGKRYSRCVVGRRIGGRGGGFLRPLFRRAGGRRPVRRRSLHRRRICAAAGRIRRRDRLDRGEIGEAGRAARLRRHIPAELAEYAALLVIIGGEEEGVIGVGVVVAELPAGCGGGIRLVLAGHNWQELGGRGGESWEKAEDAERES